MFQLWSHPLPSIMNLAEYIRRNGTIPEEAICQPWYYDGNIILISSDNGAFKVFRYLLVLKAPVLADNLNLHNLSDDNVELVDNFPFFELPDNTEDLRKFLTALHEEEEIPYVHDFFRPVLPVLTAKFRPWKVPPWTRWKPRNFSAAPCICRHDTKSQASGEKLSLRLKADIQAHYQHGTASTTPKTARSHGNSLAQPSP